MHWCTESGQGRPMADGLRELIKPKGEHQLRPAVLHHADAKNPASFFSCRPTGRKRKEKRKRGEENKVGIGREEEKKRKREKEKKRKRAGAFLLSLIVRPEIHTTGGGFWPGWLGACDLFRCRRSPCFRSAIPCHTFRTLPDSSNNILGTFSHHRFAFSTFFCRPPPTSHPKLPHTHRQLNNCFHELVGGTPCLQPNLPTWRQSSRSFPSTTPTATAHPSRKTSPYRALVGMMTTD